MKWENYNLLLIKMKPQEKNSKKNMNWLYQKEIYLVLNLLEEMMNLLFFMRNLKYNNQLQQKVKLNTEKEFLILIYQILK